MRLIAIATLVGSLTFVASDAADYALPAKNQGWWTPNNASTAHGVGVPDGFLQYVAGGASDRAVSGTVIDVTQAPYNADNTGSTDCVSALESATNAASAGDVVYLPAGTYRIDSTWDIGVSCDGITFRGDGDTTIIRWHGGSNGTMILMGRTHDTWGTTSATNAQTVTGTKTKGTETITVSNSNLFSLDVPCTIRMENETDTTRVQAGAYPTWSSGSFNYQRQFVHLVTARPTGTSITISPPLMLDSTDYAMDAEPGDSPSLDLRSVGMEDMRLETGGATPFFGGIKLGRGFYCWFYNLSFEYTDVGAAGNCIQLTSTFRCEVRHCWFTGTPADGESSFSDGAIQMQHCTGYLIEDNIFDTGRAANTWGWDVDIYSDGSTNNGVIAHNFFESGNKNVQVNHTSYHSVLMLIEGNVGQRVQQDGYHTAAANCTLYRNWFSGRNASGDAHPFGGYTSWFKRFTRGFSLVGNIWGLDGFSTGAPQYGYPNIGNDAFSGTAQPTLGDMWSDWAAYAAGTYTGSVGGFQEIDLDVEASFEIVENYESALSGGALADGTADTLPASMFRASKPDWFGNLSWPAVDPNSPPTDVTSGLVYQERIPAGYRFYNGDDPPAGGGDTDPPTPDPMTFASVPAADSSSAISMTASTATDAGGSVQYYFDETSGNPGGTDSGWQSSTNYTDTGLSPDTQYTYTVKARDPSLNETAASSAANATTDAGIDAPPVGADSRPSVLLMGGGGL